MEFNCIKCSNAMFQTYCSLREEKYKTSRNLFDTCVSTTLLISSECKVCGCLTKNITKNFTLTYTDPSNFKNCDVDACFRFLWNTVETVFCVQLNYRFCLYLIFI